MRFRDSLNRLRRIWHASVLASVGFCVGPILWLMMFSGLFRHGGSTLEGLNGHPHLDADWPLRLLALGQISCLATAAFAIATGVTYLIGKRLPDYTDIVSST